ncbi:MAG: WYL domain-containing protein [Planctomycetes bacterium]|nr:WYL domain-containing protein [Planctomycetota bacterium]
MTDDDDDDDEVGGAEAGATGEGSPERVAKSERILNLIAVLLRSDEPVPLTEILGKVTGYNDKATRDSLMRRFERDKKVLRDMGIPVEHATGTFGAEGYTIPRTAYFLDEVRLPPASAQVLRALFAWAHGGGGELSTDLRTALVKVGYLVDDDDAAPPERAREALDPKLERGPVVARNLELLSEALFRRRRVRFRYYSIGRHEEQAREVDPWGLGFAGQAWNRGAWYLVGWCHLRQAERVFKVQRIRGEVALAGRGEREGPDYEIPAGFRVREHLGRTRWEYQDLQSAFAPGPAEPPFTARVAFEAPVASEVRALVPSARVVERDDEWETLEFDVRRRRPFARFLLRYVPRLRVVDPPDLDGSVRELAREVLALYRPPVAGGGAP